MSVSAGITDAVCTESEWEGRGWFPPGPQLALCLSGEQRLADRSDAELIEIMAAARRQTAWAQARELAAIAELTARREAEDNAQDDADADPRILSASESLIEEIATALTVTGNTAAALMHTARQLARSLPGTRAALETGRIDLARTRVICEATEGLPDHTAAVLESAVLERAPSQTTGQLRRRTKSLARRLAPDAFDDQTKQTVQGRRVELWENTADTASLALLDIAAHDAHAIHNKLTAAARAIRAESRTQDDRRTLDQIRADLATRLLRGQALPEAATALLSEPPPPSSVTPPVPDAPPRPAAAEARPSVPGSAPQPIGQVAGSLPSEPSRPAQTQGTADDTKLISALAIDVDQRLTQVKARLRAAGRLDDLPQTVVSAVRAVHRSLTPFRNAQCDIEGKGRHGHPGYRPPAELRRMVQARHSTCAFPTCNRRVEHCDLDHTIAYDAHGATCGCNLAPLCRRHHRLKVRHEALVHRMEVKDLHR